MIKLCPKCGEIYNRKVDDVFYCKGCRCLTILVDELIEPIIFLLNRKGYITISSCSGHVNNPSGHIWFDDEYKLPEFDESYPSGFVISKYKNKSLIEWKLLLPNDHMEQLININNMIYSLYRYCKTLPPQEYSR